MIVNVIVDICLLPIYVMESDSRLPKTFLDKLPHFKKQL